MSARTLGDELERLRLNRRLLLNLCDRWEKEGLSKMDVSLVRFFVTER